MKKLNLTLALTALVLLAGAVITYRLSEGRAERFERGRKLLANLDPDEITAIRIREGGEELNLERRGESFRIAERDGYEARNDAVNRLLRALLDIRLEQEVGEGEKLAQELGLEPPSERSVDVELEGTGGKTLVHLRTGKEPEDGAGVFVQRLDGGDRTIFRTSGRPSFDTAPEDYLERQIVDVSAAEIARIEGPDFVAEEAFEETPAAPAPGGAAPGEGDSAAPLPAEPQRVSLGLKLSGLAAGQQAKATAMNRLESVLSRLEFQEVYPADSPQVRGLAFEPRLRVELEDSTGYVLSLAEQGEETYLQIEGYATVDRVEISRDESEEELKAKADTLSRADEINAFNAFHGSWVYLLSDSVAEKLKLRRSDLVE